MTDPNLQVLLERRPKGWPTPDDFRIVELPHASLAEGQLRVRGEYLSLDPYMRGRMNEGRSYVAPLALGDVMCGEVVGEVVESRHPKFAVGDLVAGDLGWQTHPVTDGRGLRRVDRSVPRTALLSAVGMPGVTAWAGLLQIGQPKPGETVVVSAAAGAVGSVVGQIAKLKGCRAVGIAGGPDKCRHVVEDLGFDACVDYRSEAFAVLGRMNPFSRLPVCGLISQYNATEAYGVKNFRSILVNRIRVQGFIVFDFADRYREATAELAGWLAAGQLRYFETVAQGLRAAPEAFLGMLRGANVGKQLVKLG
jgi:NADPH-dependent curcumin reductase CurA